MAGLCARVLALCCILGYVDSQLVVNVRNSGGEVFRENIQANTSYDVIRLDFQQTDGTHVTQFIDYRNEVQIFHFVIPGQQELAQPQSQAMCFLLRLNKNDFISADAMSKLRQKNPSAVRHPEEDRGSEEFELDLLVSYDHSAVLSPHIQTVCHDARDSIYVRDKDLKIITRSLNKDYTSLLGATKPLSASATTSPTPCSQTAESWRSCHCRYSNCVLWYPCGLKYCKGKDSAGKTVNYRCGIKTCRKCRRFEYHTRRRELCMWQLPEAPPVGHKDSAGEAGAQDDIAMGDDGAAALEDDSDEQNALGHNVVPL